MDDPNDESSWSKKLSIVQNWCNKILCQICNRNSDFLWTKWHQLKWFHGHSNKIEKRKYNSLTLNRVAARRAFVFFFSRIWDIVNNIDILFVLTDDQSRCSNEGKKCGISAKSIWTAREIYVWNDDEHWSLLHINLVQIIHTCMHAFSRTFLSYFHYLI